VSVDAAEADGRARLVDELDAYMPGTPHEQAMRAQLRAFVASETACFERTCAAGHVTGSAWIVDRAGQFALLTHHRKLGRWLQPGGHADGDSDVRAVALREALEESGLRSLAPAAMDIFDLDVHAIPARGSEPAHLHYDVRFAFFGDPREAPVASAESHAVAWVPLADVERFGIDDSVRRLVAKTARLVETG
jgi:8-oxo-dGTP pyrophosphatase MutT (NUDIX family)